MKDITKNRLVRRKSRVSMNINGTSERPRICIFRSNVHIYAQAIDDVNRKTLAAFSTLKLKTKTKKTEMAKQVGKELAALLKEKNITKGVFDRNKFTYLGRVKGLAEGLREGGLSI